MKIVRFITIMISVFFWTASCKSTSSDHSNLTESPLADQEAERKITEELRKLGYKVSISDLHTNQDGRRQLFLSMDKQWTRLRHKFQIIMDEFQSAKSDDDQFEINITNRFSVETTAHKPTLEIIGSSSSYKALFDTQDPADLVARTLDVIYNILISNGYKNFTTDSTPKIIYDFLRGESGKQKLRVSDTYIRGRDPIAPIRDLLLAPRVHFDLFLSSIQDINTFLGNNSDKISNIWIKDENLYQKVPKRLYISVSSKEFPEIVKAMKANDIVGVGKLVDEE